MWWGEVAIAAKDGARAGDGGAESNVLPQELTALVTVPVDRILAVRESPSARIYSETTRAHTLSHASIAGRA